MSSRNKYYFCGYVVGGPSRHWQGKSENYKEGNYIISLLLCAGLSLLHHKLDANDNQENGAHEDEGLGLGDLVNGSDLFG